MDVFQDVERNDVESVKAIIAGGSVDVNEWDRAGNTPLLAAVRKGFVDCVKALLEANADAGKGDYEKYTPVHSASHHGSVEILKLLIAYGAKVNTLDLFNTSPLQLAAQRGHIGCIDELV